MRYLIVAILLCVPFSLGMMLADPLTNTKWPIKVEPDGQAPGNEKPFDDVLSFTGENTFNDQALSKRGFKATVYESRMTQFAPATFIAEQKSDKGESAKWSGTIAAVTIGGELTITKKDGSSVHYTYQGTKQGF